MIESIPQFLPGLFAFSGAGYDSPVSISGSLDDTVPGAKRAQRIYFRGGDSSGDLVSVVLRRDGEPMRDFPIGAHAGTPVPLAVVEDLEPDRKVTLAIGASAGAAGSLVVAVGRIEI